MSEPGAPARQGGTFVVALTGGIASGKSTVAAWFQQLGVEVIDTDLIARQLVEPGEPLLASVVAAFGQELLDAYGRLKRRTLREIIFRNPDKREQLEAIMHPEIAAEARRQINQVQAPYCILAVPLLAEKGGLPGADRVLMVDATAETQLARLTRRDNVTEAQARAAMESQASRKQRLAYAHDVISNDGSLEELQAQVERLHLAYLEKSLARR
jgi:dephospho-CoA kinase